MNLSADYADERRLRRGLSKITSGNAINLRGQNCRGQSKITPNLAIDNCRGQSKITPNLAIDHDNENFTLTPSIMPPSIMPPSIMPPSIMPPFIMPPFIMPRNYSPPPFVIPAKAGIQSIKLSLAIHYNVSFQDNAFHWIPACAGMTGGSNDERGGE